MNSPETLPDFHQRYLAAPLELPAGAPSAAQFYVYSSSQPKPQLLPYQRRDFYKIALLTAGTGQLHYASRSLKIASPALIFSNPLVPYSWAKEAGPHLSLYCSFTEAFWQGGAAAQPASLANLPLFRSSGDPVFLLKPAEVARFEALFEHLVTEAATGYVHKADVLRNYVQLLLHEAQKLQPPATYTVAPSADSRIAGLFLELLGRQFPLAAPRQALALRTPHDYAEALAIHVNYLNRAVRRATGQTTSAHLAGRLLREATALLQHSTWSVGDISDGLGFAYPTYFNTFYKRHTGATPLQARQTGQLLV